MKVEERHGHNYRSEGLQFRVFVFFFVPGCFKKRVWNSQHSLEGELIIVSASLRTWIYTWRVKKYSLAHDVHNIGYHIDVLGGASYHLREPDYFSRLSRPGETCARVLFDRKAVQNISGCRKRGTGCSCWCCCCVSLSPSLPLALSNLTPPVRRRFRAYHSPRGPKILSWWSISKHGSRGPVISIWPTNRPPVESLTEVPIK